MRWIPCTATTPASPKGSAAGLLERMREQACKYGGQVERFVTKLERDEQSGLYTRPGARGRPTRSVLIATGVTNRRPPMDEEPSRRGPVPRLVRYCPICDGYEVTDKRVGVIGATVTAWPRRSSSGATPPTSR